MSDEKEMSDLDYLPKIEAVYKNLVKYVQQGININGWGDLPEAYTNVYDNFGSCFEGDFGFFNKEPFLFVETEFFIDNEHDVVLKWCPQPLESSSGEKIDSTVDIKFHIGGVSFQTIYEQLYALLTALEKLHGSAYDFPRLDKVELLDFGYNPKKKDKYGNVDRLRYVDIDGYIYKVSPIPESIAENDNEEDAS